MKRKNNQIILGNALTGSEALLLFMDLINVTFGLAGYTADKNVIIKYFLICQMAGCTLFYYLTVVVVVADRLVCVLTHKYKIYCKTERLKMVLGGMCSISFASAVLFCLMDYENMMQLCLHVYIFNDFLILTIV